MSRPSSTVLVVQGIHNKQKKNGSEEIHQLKEVRHITTAVGQRKYGACTKWDSKKDRAVPWGDLKPIEPPKLSFLIKEIFMLGG